MTNEYLQQAKEFLELTDTSFNIVRIGTYDRLEFGEPTDVYLVTLKNDKHEYEFKFSDSIHNTQCRLGTLKPPRRMSIYDFEKYKAKMQRNHKIPNEYDVLACLQSSEVGSLEDFCSDYGYSDDSIKAEETYRAVRKEHNNISSLFSYDELELLREIN